MEPKFEDIVNNLNVLARNAIQLSLKFTNSERAKLVVEAYTNPRKGSNDRANLQQEWCDIVVAVDDAKRTLEKAGLTNLNERYEQG